MTKKLGWLLLSLYLGTLIWILLFKFSISLSDLSALHNQSRSLNLIPFSQSGIVNHTIDWSEIIANVIIFLPFGLLLRAISNLSITKSVSLIFGFSLVIETLQFIFSLGATDVTDLLTNTLGGILGLGLYASLAHFIPTKRLNQWLIYTGTLLFAIAFGLLVFLLVVN